MKTKGIYFLYRALQWFGLPLLLLYCVYRSLRNRAYWGTLPQRFGFLGRSYRQTGPGAVWLHAVSVGEIVTGVELLRQLRRQFPHAPLFVSTSTLAGRATARDQLRGLADGVFYAPFDYVFAVRRVLRALQPAVVLVAETEIWPNLFREVKRTGAGLAIVNGRISDPALRRYRPFRWFFRAVLPAADFILAQTGEIASRFTELGAPPERVRVGGNLKYDFEPRQAPPDSPVRAFLARTKPEQVWIAASTMPPAVAGDVDEDDAVIAAFAEIAARRPGLLLLLVPRKPERFDSAAQKLEAAGLRYLRRSSLAAGGAVALPAVLLLDTIGELSGLFASADVVFMGGTLARRGGHNILEPAFFSKPVVAGPHMQNFQAIADQFRAEDACVRIASASELAGAVERLLADPSLAAAIGARALACAEARRGATARTVEQVRALYSAGVPHYSPSIPWRPLAWALSLVWKAGGARRRARDLAHQRRLAVPVVSVGNLTMGGTGKTPAVVLLAEALNQRGRRPGILTRGYGRNSPHKHLAVAPGAAGRPEHTGDEPQILIRSGVAPVGIGPNRFQTGQLLQTQFGVDVLLLDDGFQHLRLARDVDVVLIDAISPFGGGGLFPLGRLREPLDGLARAHLILLTRSGFSDLAPGIEAVVRRVNPDAPIFRARVQAREWVDRRTGLRYPASEPPFGKAGAFCGLGNPQSFRRTLESLGIDLADWVEFEDHHRYRANELRRIAGQFRAAGATALLTTEKDEINLCDGAGDLLAPLPLYWLKVGMEIERKEDFLAEIDRRIAQKIEACPT